MTPPGMSLNRQAAAVQDVTWTDIMTVVKAYDLAPHFACVWGVTCACGARMKARTLERPRCRGCQWRDRSRAKRHAAAQVRLVIVDEVND